MIAIAMHDFHAGGTERVAIALAALWADQGRAVTILCGSEEGGLRAGVDPRVRVESVGIRRGLLSRLRLGPALARRLTRLAPDIVFLPGNYHLLLAPALHGIAPIAAKISNPPLPFASAAPLFRHLGRSVSGFAAMNAGLTREIRALMPAKPAATLYDPVLTRPLPPIARASAAEIVWIGRLEPQKDPSLALRTLREMLKTRGAHLTLIGDGSRRGQIARAAADLPVTLVPKVADVAPYLAAADALLVTSRYEGGPAVAVEALAQGMPVVATDCSHLLQEIIAHEAGRIVPSRDPAALAMALGAVLDAPRPAAGAFAPLVERFAPRTCAMAYLDWFKTL